MVGRGSRRAALCGHSRLARTLAPPWATRPQIGCQSSLRMWSSGGRSRSNCATVAVLPGRIRSGAISLNGCSTNRRRCARGWGSVSSLVDRTSSPKAIKSKSNGRGAFRIVLGPRPNSFSSSRNTASRDSGVSPARGVNPAMALMKSGEPGGQSTGAVRHREDINKGDADSVCSRSMACRRIWHELPIFEPRAMNAGPPPVWAGGLLRLSASRFMQIRASLEPGRADQPVGLDARQRVPTGFMAGHAGPRETGSC